MRQRLSARDYKHGGRREGGFGLAQYRQFGLGLAVGLGVALLVWVQAQRELAAQAVPEAPTANVQAAAPAQEAEAAEQYDFYDMLPNFEVEVPEAERRTSRNEPAAPIAQPGAYVLQAGSFRNRADAERQRDRLSKQGMDASLQHVTIDENEWHRVRIGPSRDLAQINAWREQLRTADVKFTVYQIEE